MAAVKGGIDRSKATSPWKFCQGCPHISTLSAMKKAVGDLGYDKYVAPADAGCVALGVFPPLEAVHTSICMGSSIGIATGLVKSGIKEPVFAVIGDSAFFHTGLPALVNAAWHDVKITVIICDNACAAMTGLQPSPTSKDRDKARSKLLNIKDAALGCSVKFVEEFDPLNFEQAVECIKRGLTSQGPAVLVAKSPCIKLCTRA
jgi:indolepyruvate ferredoxin oxidoreductase alpha subunit